MLKDNMGKVFSATTGCYGCHNLIGGLICSNFLFHLHDWHIVQGHVTIHMTVITCVTFDFRSNSMSLNLPAKLKNQNSTI